MRRTVRHFLTCLLAMAPAALFAQDKFEKYAEKIPGTTVQFDMVPIPAGEYEFKLNKDAEPKKVAVKRFWMGKTEVTWDEYDVFAFCLDIPDEKERVRLQEAKIRPSKPYSAPDFGFGHNGYACLAIHKNAAEAYCKWLSEKTGRKYRLPTAEEWEWAARGGADAKAPDALDDYAWHQDNSEEKTQAVGKKKPNGYGLHDTLGNAVEWLSTKTPEGKNIAAGGSWKSKPALLNPGYRQVETAAWQVTDPQDPKSKWWLSDGTFVSFRVVREE